MPENRVPHELAFNCVSLGALEVPLATVVEVSWSL
jgi:hypothetical protein